MWASRPHLDRVVTARRTRSPRPGRRGRAWRTRCAQADRLGERDHLGRRAHVVADAAEPVGEQLLKRSGAGRAAVQPPHPVRAAQAPRLQPGPDQLPQGTARSPALRRCGWCATPRSIWPPSTARSSSVTSAWRSGGTLIRHHPVVPPQRAQHGAEALAAADRADQEGPPRAGELVRQGRRRLVKQVRVVDQHDQPAGGPPAGRASRTARNNSSRLAGGSPRCGGNPATAANGTCAQASVAANRTTRRPRPRARASTPAARPLFPTRPARSGTRRPCPAAAATRALPRSAARVRPRETASATPGLPAPHLTRIWRFACWVGCCVSSESSTWWKKPREPRCRRSSDRATQSRRGHHLVHAERTPGGRTGCDGE